MFQLAVISDVFPLDPMSFNKDHLEQLRVLIHSRYTDRVIPKVGLGIAMHSLVEIENSRILPGDGRAHFKVTFRLLVFAPFVGEILEGIIESQSEMGLQIGLQFFKDITIPLVWLREPRKFDESTGTWMWEFENQPLPYRCGDSLRFRVRDVSFADTTRVHPLAIENETPQTAMTIIGSVTEDGLGPRIWWE